jgi:hypothetical protein
MDLFDARSMHPGLGLGKPPEDRYALFLYRFP